ncbi:acylphosphatase [Peribacillus sp. SCS-26]|uniref:acylphosphatase n=1 Tax=Paraperibacillus marinus TaxID=3115295 RepID=UPI003905F744
MKQLHLIVKGRVQGVGFRYFTQMEAMEHGIKGWVKNNDDGSVEIMAQGKQEDLSAFLSRIEKGSPFSKVDSVISEETPAAESLTKFTIKG